MPRILKGSGAMKRKLSQAEYDKLDDAGKALYKENSSRKGEFLLELEDDDTGALQRAKDRETQKAADLQAKLDAATTELEEIKAAASAAGDEGARKKGDVVALEKSWQAKLDKAKADHAAAMTKKDTALSKLLVEARADEMANRISTAPSLLKPIIRARLMADLDGEEPATRVVGSDGKPSATTLEELEKEIVTNKEYAAILIGSKASGALPTRDTRKMPSSAGKLSEKSFAHQTPHELVAALKAKHGEA